MASRLNVLVCEDDPVQAHLIAMLIERQGLNVIGPMTTPDQAIRGALRTDVDAALLDVCLDGGTVSEAADLLEKQGVPFAFLTGYGPQTTSTLGTHPGHLTIPKPISSDVFAEILDCLLPQRARPVAAE